MRLFKSLRLRLIAAATVWLVIALGAGYFAFSYIFRTQVEAQFDEELEVHSEEVERITRFNRLGVAVERLPFSDPRYEDVDSGFYWEVEGPERVMFSSGSLAGRRIGRLPQDSARGGKPRIETVEGPTGPMIVIARYGPSEEGGFRFAVGTDLHHVEAAVHEFDDTLLLALGGLGAMLFATVLGLITFGFAPFSRLARAMRQVRSGATQSIEGDYPTEVEPLVTELNSLIKGQRESLQRARAQAGNLAHALKSPLAIAADEAYQLDQRGEKEAGKIIAEQCKAMQMHIDHHIARARAQAVSRLPGTRSNVAENVASVVNALARLHVQRGVQVEQQLDRELRVAMDGQDFAELIANLIDNAFKFARGRIVVTAAAEGSKHIRVSIEDDGPGLPPQAREIVFAPGIRLDETRPGTGLGLSIVRDLLELYGGEIELGASSLGGLAAILKLNRHQ